MNSVNLIGRLTADPELKQTPDGTFVCTFDIAVGRIGKDSADFPTIRTWGKIAENVTKYLRKGAKISVSGCLHTNIYSKNGMTVKSTEVNASSVEFIENKKSAETSEEADGQAYEEFDETDDADYPF